MPNLAASRQICPWCPELGFVGAVQLAFRRDDLENSKSRSRLGAAGARNGIRSNPGLLNVISFIPVGGLLITLVTFVWTFAGMVVEVRQSLDYTSTMRALFVILLAFIPVLITNTIVFVPTGGN